MTTIDALLEAVRDGRLKVKTVYVAPADVEVVADALPAEVAVVRTKWLERGKVAFEVVAR